jgi:pimeloyl-ACP methyl ester carboxylesterase
MTAPLPHQEVPMPYATNKGIRIHYKIEGEGAPLVLQHGIIGNLEEWYEAGYVAALQGSYRLILIDARGHGDSDKPHDSASYGVQMVTDIVAVLDELGIAQAHYFGYSLGGGLGFWLGRNAPERVHSLILGGASLSAGIPRADSDARIAMLSKGMEGFVAALEQQAGRPLPADRKSKLLQNDAEALLAVVMANRDTPTMEAPSVISMPCLLFAGEADPTAYPGIKEDASQMPNATWFSLPGLNHPQGFRRSDLVLPRVTKFLAIPR